MRFDSFLLCSHQAIFALTCCITHSLHYPLTSLHFASSIFSDRQILSGYCVPFGSMCVSFSVMRALRPSFCPLIYAVYHLVDISFSCNSYDLPAFLTVHSHVMRFILMKHRSRMLHRGLRYSYGGLRRHLAKSI